MFLLKNKFFQLPNVGRRKTCPLHLAAFLNILGCADGWRRVFDEWLTDFKNFVKMKFGKEKLRTVKNEPKQGFELKLGAAGSKFKAQGGDYERG